MDGHLVLNSEGNVFFQRGDFDSAASKFTAALSLESDSNARSILLSNRSSVFLKLGKYDEAILDAIACIKLRPKWSKGYIRWGKALEANGEFSKACNVYVNAIKRGEGHEELLLQPLIDLNKDHKVFSDEFMEVLQHRNDKYCEVCCETADLFRCSRCCVVRYCSKGHQKQDWSKHKTQCRMLADAYQYLSHEKALKIQSNLPWMTLKKEFHSLGQIRKWSNVWEHLECVANTSDIFRCRMSESLSWCLTLIGSLGKFSLINEKKLIVHILGADDHYFKEGYFTYFPGFFPFPDMEIVLIGPELIHNTSPLSYKNAAGNSISISFFSDVWHKFMTQPSFLSPDIILACHPGIHEDVYEWEPTLSAIISHAIPTVFTAWHEEDYVEMVRVLGTNIYDVNFLFKGEAPFPSLVQRYARKSWNEYGIQKMNSYWVGFRGNVEKSV